LPPIGEAGYFTSREPDYLLTEVHRQALNSPVIKLATVVRNRITDNAGWLRPGRYGDSAVVRPSLSIDELLNHDQIIVGTHRTRTHINKAVRAALGYEGDLPCVGERLLCLKNNRCKGLRNGTLWTVTKIVDEDDDGYIELVVKDDNNNCVEVSAPIEAFLIKDGSGGEIPGDPFTYGYAITCHKAQGSQWGSVAVIDESHCFRRHRWHWLYTAITRAAERVTVECPS
jgi:exodeoxyribonuclease-5